MATRYSHTQKGTLLLIVLLALLPLTAVLVVRQASPWLLLPFAFLIPVVVIFSRLTISVTDELLVAKFGWGWPWKQVAVAQIASVHVVHNPWYYGYGIRFTPHGTLYNVSGTRGVEIRLLNGTRFRLGSDQPVALRDAIEGAMADHSTGSPAAHAGGVS